VCAWAGPWQRPNCGHPDRTPPLRPCSRGRARTLPPFSPPLRCKSRRAPRSPISFLRTSLAASKHPTSPPRSSAAKCPLPDVVFRRLSSEIVEKSLSPHLFSELRCSPSPSQHGHTSSCSLSLSLSLVPKNLAASPLATGRRHRRWKPAMPPLLHHLDGAAPPQ
jgi:hypothetical protein